MNDLEKHKAAIKAELGRELRSKVEEIRASRDGMTFQAAFNEVKKREPALFAYIARVEANDWTGEGKKERSSPQTRQDRGW